MVITREKLNGGVRDDIIQNFYLLLITIIIQTFFLKNLDKMSKDKMRKKKDSCYTKDETPQARRSGSPPNELYFSGGKRVFRFHFKVPKRNRRSVLGPKRLIYFVLNNIFNLKGNCVLRTLKYSCANF